MRERLLSITALLLIGAIWAVTFPLSRIAVLGGYRAFGIIFWSSVIAVVLLGGILGIRRKTLPLHRPALARYLFIGLFGTMLPSTTSYTAAIHLPAGVSSIVISLVPLVSLLMAISIGLDRATVTKVAGLGWDWPGCCC